MSIHCEKDAVCLVDNSARSLSCCLSKQISENKTAEPVIELGLAALPAENHSHDAKRLGRAATAANGFVLFLCHV